MGVLFLSLLSAACWLAITFTFPETARSVVGNGQVHASLSHRAVLRSMQAAGGAASCQSNTESKRRLHVLNPLSTLLVLSKPDSFIIVFSIAVLYMVYTCLQVSLSAIMYPLYNLTQTEAGLTYLPFGVGCALSALLTGIYTFRSM